MKRKKPLLLFLVATLVGTASCGINDFASEKNISVSVRLDLKKDRSFNTKTSEDGFPVSVYLDVQSVVIALSKDSVNPFSNPVDSKVFLGPSSPFSVSFNNLKPNSTYYIGAKAYSDVIQSNNITKGQISLTSEYVTVDSTGKVFIINDAPTVGDWNLVINLNDSLGANIDTSINLQNGDLGPFKTDIINVSKYTGSETQYSQKISITDGNGMVVWKDNKPIVGIYGRFIKDFFPDGNDFRIDQNATPGNSPSLAVADNQNGFVTWERSDGSKNRIFMRHMAGLEFPLGEIIVDNNPSENNSMSKINTGIAKDTGIIVWQSDTGNIIARGFYSSDGFKSFNLGTTSSTLTVLGINITPDVSKLSSAGYGLIVWGENTPPKKIMSKIFQVNSSDGSLSPDAITYDISQTGDAIKPSISLNASGSGMVVWEKDTGDKDIYARRIIKYRANGPEFKVAGGVSFQSDPKISLNDKGNGLIVWKEGNDTKVYGMKVINFDIMGLPFQISSNISMVNENFPDLGMDLEGRGLVIWEDDKSTSGSDTDIRGQRIINFQPE